MPELDPREHEIAELGPKLRDVDDPDELRAMLDLEREGDARPPVETLIEDRIEKVSGDEGGELDPETVDLADRSAADIANMVREIDDADVLRDILERERDGADRSSAITQIENRIDSVEGSEERAEPVETVPPEEKYPSSTTRPTRNSGSRAPSAASTATCGSTARPGRVR